MLLRMIDIMIVLVLYMTMAWGSIYWTKLLVSHFAENLKSSRLLFTCLFTLFGCTVITTRTSRLQIHYLDLRLFFITSTGQK